MSNTKKVLKNTVLLYIRMFAIMIINLYMVRLLLEALGDIDYGIYNVVGGFVLLFSFLIGSLSSSCQRFFSYYLGKKDFESLNKVLSINKILFYTLSVIIVTVILLFGAVFVKYILVIPVSRIDSSIIVLYFSVASFIISLMTIPYVSLILSSENMGVYSLISVFEVLLKLMLVIILKSEHYPYDKLVGYSCIMFISPFLSFLFYRFYSITKYKYIKFSFIWDRILVREIISYNGWHLLGTISVAFKAQGVNILINMFFSPVINAARGIAFQVSTGISTLSVNFFSAVKPQLYKTYSKNDITGVNKLILISSKLTFMLMIVLSIPFYLEIDFILELWLTHIPTYTVIFTKLVIINAIIDALSEPLIAGILATGKVKRFEITVSLIIFMNFIFSYVFLKLGYNAEITMYISICVSIVAHFARFYFINTLLHLSLNTYMEMLIRLIVTVLISYILVSLISSFTEKGFFKLCLTTFYSVIIVLLMMYAIGLSVQERKLVNKFICNFYGKFKGYFA